MRTWRRVRAWSLAICGMLSACNEGPNDKAPNTTRSGLVKEIRKNSSCSKLSGCAVSYQVVFDVSGSRAWYGSVNESRINEDDLRRIIGQPVTFTCYRDTEIHDGRELTTCSSALMSLRWNGRELIKNAR